MAKLVIQGDDIVVRMSGLEKLAAFHGDVRVPLRAVANVRVADAAYRELRGIRAPGTGWPGRIAIGTRRYSGRKDFACIVGKQAAVVVELDGAPYGRLVIGSSDPEGDARRVAAALPGQRS
ncbi:MAG TPA: hypothetical protein VFC33_06065 [Acidimicrobiia bacterium]|nr:hypothetical protein [Acidimicrobiia bacterium]